MKKIILLSFICSLIFLSGIPSVFAVSCSCKCKDSNAVTIEDGIGPCGTKCGSGNYEGCNTIMGDIVVTKTNIATSTSNNTAPQTLPNPLGITDINAFIARIITFVLSLVGSVSLLLFVYGGITWMTSMGNDTKIKKGKDIVVWAVIGLAVVFFAYILVKFVIQGITG